MPSRPTVPITISSPFDRRFRIGWLCRHVLRDRRIARPGKSTHVGHEGAVRGLGGLLSSLEQLQRLQRRALRGGDEHVTMLPGYSSQSDGPAVRVSLLTGEAAQ